MKIATSTKLISISIIISAVIMITSPLCTPPDTRWTHYITTIPPVEFEGTLNSGGCTGTNCTDMAVLGDGDYGTPALNVNAVHAWYKTVTVVIVFRFSTSVRVRGINLYFYNIPSRNIGLPYDTYLTSSPSFIEGNQDLSQNENQLRSVTLIPSRTIDNDRFAIKFSFSNIDKIDWLLLTEVELCTSVTVNINPTLLPISFTGDTVSNISPTSINSTISLSCYVVNEGRFVWNWTLPSGDTQPPTFILDTGRTSVIEVTSNETGDYQCHVGYSGLASDLGPSAMFTITLSLEDETSMTTDIMTTDIMTTDIMTTDIMTTDIVTTDTTTETNGPQDETSTLPPTSTTRFTDETSTLPPTSTTRFTDETSTLPPTSTTRFTDETSTLPPTSTTRFTDETSTSQPTSTTRFTDETSTEMGTSPQGFGNGTLVGLLIGTHLSVFIIGLVVGLLLMGGITVCIVKKLRAKQSDEPRTGAGPIYEDVNDCKQERIGLDIKTNEAYGMVSSSH